MSSSGRIPVENMLGTTFRNRRSAVRNVVSIIGLKNLRPLLLGNRKTLYIRSSRTIIWRTDSAASWQFSALIRRGHSGWPLGAVVREAWRVRRWQIDRLEAAIFQNIVHLGHIDRGGTVLVQPGRDATDIAPGAIGVAGLESPYVIARCADLNRRGVMEDTAAPGDLVFIHGSVCGKSARADLRPCAHKKPEDIADDNLPWSPKPWTCPCRRLPVPDNRPPGKIGNGYARSG